MARVIVPPPPCICSWFVEKILRHGEKTEKTEKGKNAVSQSPSLQSKTRSHTPPTQNVHRHRVTFAPSPCESMVPPTSLATTGKTKKHTSNNAHNPQIDVGASSNNERQTRLWNAMHEPLPTLTKTRRRSESVDTFNNRLTRVMDERLLNRCSQLQEIVYGIQEQIRRARGVQPVAGAATHHNQRRDECECFIATKLDLVRVVDEHLEQLIQMSQMLRDELNIAVSFAPRFRPKNIATNGSEDRAPSTSYCSS